VRGIVTLAEVGSLGRTVREPSAEAGQEGATGGTSVVGAAIATGGAIVIKGVGKAASEGVTITSEGSPASFDLGIPSEAIVSST